MDALFALLAAASLATAADRGPDLARCTAVNDIGQTCSVTCPKKTVARCENTLQEAPRCACDS